MCIKLKNQQTSNFNNQNFLKEGFDFLPTLHRTITHATYKFHCVNPISRSWRTYKSKPNNTHVTYLSCGNALHSHNTMWSLGRGGGLPSMWHYVICVINAWEIHRVSRTHIRVACRVLNTLQHVNLFPFMHSPTQKRMHEIQLFAHGC